MMQTNIVDRIYPLVTEKSFKLSEAGYFAFLAPKEVTKPQMKRALTFLYPGNKILDLKSIRSKGKAKKFRGVWGKRKEVKKFYIRFDKAIDITTKVK
jgi:large subunit ribosomal protein L23